MRSNRTLTSGSGEGSGSRCPLGGYGFGDNRSGGNPSDGRRGYGKGADEGVGELPRASGWIGYGSGRGIGAGSTESGRGRGVAEVPRAGILRGRT